MEKLNLNYNNLDFQEILSFIKNSSLGKQIIQDLNLTDKEIIDHYELINNYIKINKRCESCKSMTNCDHSTKGHRYGLKRDLDNQLTDYFTICNIYKDYYQKKKNLLYSTFNEEELLDESQKNFILDNVNILGMDFVKKIIAIQKGIKVNGAYLQVANSKIRLKLVKSLAYALLANHNVSIVKFSDLLKVIKSEFKITGNNTYQTIIDSEILILDGLGNEAITTWSRDEILLSILDNRLQSDKITILCSEFSLDDLKKLYKVNYNDEVKVNQIIEKINEIKK